MHELSEVTKVTSKYESIALGESSSHPVRLRAVTDVQQAMRVNA